MVYESDFYTTRRPYSRPSYTSYSVSPHPFYYSAIPRIAHQKMTNVTMPVPHNQVRKSVIHGVLDKIQYRPRSLTSYDPMEDFLNERSVTSFEDVTRSIRAHTAGILKRVNSPIPKAIRPLSSSHYNYMELPISERITNDEYICHLLRPLPSKVQNGFDISYYPETARAPLGKTHLACLSYAGNHTIPRRRHLILPGDENRNVRNDVVLLSHYSKARRAANTPRDHRDTAGISSTNRQYTTPANIHSEKNDQSEEDKENIDVNTKPIKNKRPSKDVSFDEFASVEKKNAITDQSHIEKEEIENAKKAEENKRLEEQKIEQERLEEQKRIAEELAEQQRLEEEQKLKEELEEQKRLEEETIATQKRLEEELEEQKRIEEELAEEKRLEDERREEEIAEQKRIEQELATQNSINDVEEEKNVEQTIQEEQACQKIFSDLSTEQEVKDNESEYEEASDEEPAFAETVEKRNENEDEYSERRVSYSKSEEVKTESYSRRKSSMRSQGSIGTESNIYEESINKSEIKETEDEEDTEAGSEISDTEVEPVIDEPEDPEPIQNNKHSISEVTSDEEEEEEE